MAYEKEKRATRHIDFTDYNCLFLSLAESCNHECRTNGFDIELSIKAGKMKKIHLKEDERPHSEVIRI